MVNRQDNHNQAMLLINKLLGPSAASSAGPPPPHPPHMVAPGYPPYPAYHPPPTHYYPPPPAALPPPQLKTPEKVIQVYDSPERDTRARGSSSSKRSEKRKSGKRRYDEARSKTSSFDALIASHGTNKSNRKELTVEMLVKEPRDRLPKREVRLAAADGSSKRKKKSGPVARAVNHSYTDLGDLADDPVARKRRKIQEKVRSKRDSAKEEEGKKESVYDYMHFDPDKEALKRKKERILRGEVAAAAAPPTIATPAIAPVLEEAGEVKEGGEEEKEEGEAEEEEEEGQLADTPTPAPEKPPKPELPTTEQQELGEEEEEMETDTGRGLAVITPTFSEPRSIPGSFSRPASPKPSESEIKALLEEMEEGELSEDEEEYNKLINDVETTRKPAAPPRVQPMETSSHSAGKRPSTVKKVNQKQTPTVTATTAAVTAPPAKTIPFLSSLKDADKKEVSILDDLAFLNSIKTKYHSGPGRGDVGGRGAAAAAAPPEEEEEPTPEQSIELKSKELIEQLLRQDKISKEREKQRKNKEKQRERDRRERERVRQERKKEKAERKKAERDMTDLLAAFIPSAAAAAPTASPTKPNKAAVAAVAKLKTEFKSNFVKGDQVMEATHDRSAIDRTVLSSERQAEAAQFVETSEHRYDNGLVIQTSTKKVDDTELLEKTRPVRYDFSKVNAGYPEFAVAGAITYRLKEKKQKLIHRVVDRIGKEKALELLFKTEAIEKRGGEMTSAGDRRKEPGGVFLGLLRKECSEDDVKYIFTVEEELTTAQQQARKKHQRILKKRRYQRNKTDRKLLNALESSLTISSKDDKAGAAADSTKPGEEAGEEEEEEDPVLGFIPDTTLAPVVPFMEKPKKFELSYTKPVEGYQLLTVEAEEKKVAPAAASKMASMIQAYGSFVKKGTSLSTDVFKPSVKERMTAEPDLFDNLLRETSNKQRAAAEDPPPAAEDDGVQEEDQEQKMEGAPEIGPQQPSQPLTCWDAPIGLKTLAPDRASAIQRSEVDPADLSEGECSGSDNEMS